jgi:hypothetical protein
MGCAAGAVEAAAAACITCIAPRPLPSDVLQPGDHAPAPCERRRAGTWERPHCKGTRAPLAAGGGSQQALLPGSCRSGHCNKKAPARQAVTSSCSALRPAAAPQRRAHLLLHCSRCGARAHAPSLSRPDRVPGGCSDPAAPHAARASRAGRVAGVGGERAAAGGEPPWPGGAAL